MEFYYYSHGQRNGPIDTAKLKELVQQRIIVPDVPVECEGKIYPARKVKGLEFPQDPPELPPVMPEPEPKDEPKDADQPAPETKPIQSQTVMQPIIQPIIQPVQIPSPKRSSRSILQPRYIRDLEHASKTLRHLAWLFVICGMICFIGGIIFGFVASEKELGEETVWTTEALLVGSGLNSIIFGMFTFYFAALGNYFVHKD